jgi:putative membrane protein
LAGLSETPHDDGALSAPNDRLAVAPSTQDFVHKVAISDMFEIQSSQLAVAKQADADTKPFAEKMVQDHQKTSSELRPWSTAARQRQRCPRRSIPNIRRC